MGTLAVWKFPVKVEDYVAIEMPAGAKLLAFQAQHEQPCLWALVDPAAPVEMRRFRLAGTGHPIKEVASNLSHIGTCQMLHGGLIFHLFEVKA